jgi:hypothetical protein
MKHCIMYHCINISLKGGGVAELVAPPPMVPNRISKPTNVSLERRLFKLMTDEKYKISHMFHMGLVFKITLRWFNVLRSVRTLNHLTDRRQAFKLDQLVTIQCVAINTHE